MHYWLPEESSGSGEPTAASACPLDSKTRLSLQLRCQKPGEPVARQTGVVTLPLAGYFHPRLPTHIQICDSAAEQWAVCIGQQQAHEVLETFRERGVTTLILAADATRCLQFHRMAEASYRGTIEISSLGPTQLITSLRRLQLARQDTLNVHGVLMKMHGLGVLLAGQSGVGKSELALELLSRGHQLVSDDAVELRRVGRGCLLGSSPELLAGFIEARGLGILDARALFGKDAIAPPTRVDLIIELYERPTPLRAAQADARLHGLRTTRNFLGESIPVISLSRRLGHNLAVLAEAGCRDHWLRVAGYHADMCFIKKQQSRIDFGVDRRRPD